MKKDLHPKLNDVCFVDAATKSEFLAKSTMSSGEKKTVNGVEYFVVNVQVSSDSHPFFTGEQKHFDTAGRIEKFEKRFSSIGKAKKPAANANSEEKAESKSKKA